MAVSNDAVPGQLGGGHLVALPDRWEVVCSTRCPEHRWGPSDWEGLGRTARAKADELDALLAWGCSPPNKLGLTRPVSRTQ
jgi:hypothetical protein